MRDLYSNDVRTAAHLAQEDGWPDERPDRRELDRDPGEWPGIVTFRFDPDDDRPF